MKRSTFLLVGLLLLLLLAQGAQAMSSPAYQVDWTNLLTGSGGPASSPAYQVNFTVGQTADDVSSSPLYKVSLGYWAGVLPPVTLFLPRISKD